MFNTIIIHRNVYNIIRHIIILLYRDLRENELLRLTVYLCVNHNHLINIIQIIINYMILLRIGEHPSRIGT